MSTAVEESFTIIDEEIVPAIKRSLDVRLDRKVSEEVLSSIATKLRNSDPNTYERTFIGYYLPGMEVDRGYWATTHFNPELEVRILGLRVEEERSLQRQPENPRGEEVIGTWIDERPFLGKRIRIFRSGGKVFMENHYDDGSSGTNELAETKTRQGQRFDTLHHSKAGDHWILRSNGNLELRDDAGLIATFKKSR